MQEKKEFKSVTDEVKCLVYKKLDNGVECSRVELCDFVKANVENAETFRENIFTGAIKYMTGSGQLETVRRGVYKIKGEVESLSLNDRIICILEHCKDSLKKVCCVNILEVSENDLQTAKQVKEFTGEIEKEIAKYELEPVKVVPTIIKKGKVMNI